MHELVGLDYVQKLPPSAATQRSQFHEGIALDAAGCRDGRTAIHLKFETPGKGGDQKMLQVQQEGAPRKGIPAMLSVPRGLVLQQGLPGAALENKGGRAQAVLHQMGMMRTEKIVARYVLQIP